MHELGAAVGAVFMEGIHPQQVTMRLRLGGDLLRVVRDAGAVGEHHRVAPEHKHHADACGAAPPVTL